MQWEQRYRGHIAELSARYDAALEAAGFDAVVLHSGLPAAKHAQDDQYWPLRPSPHFQHWLPLAQPDCAVIYRPGRRPRLHRPAVEDFWEGTGPPVDDALLAAFDVEIAPPGRPPALGGGRVALIAERTGWAPDDALFTGDDVAPLRLALDGSRVRKTPYEQDCMAEANRTAAIGHSALAAHFAAGGASDSELSLHLAYLAVTAQDDSWTPYKNIVAMGRNAATLHHVHYGTSPAAAQTSLLVDAGAMHLGYHSDVTRTTVRGDGADARDFAALVDSIDGMQRAVCAEIRIGEGYERLHDRAHHHLAQVLLDHGLCRGAPGALVERGVTRVFFPHGLGHSLGLQTHDVGCRPRPPSGDNPYLRNTSTIAVDQVFTIEPGCYFIDALLGPLRAGPHSECVDFQRVAQLHPFGGIRIEDNILVTPDGHRNLTREAFAALAV